MAKRYKIKKKASRKQFSKAAVKTNRRNVSPPPMRGGYRL